MANQKGIHISGSAALGVDPLLLDVLWFGRALNNLVINAIRHTSFGGCIRLTAEPFENGVLLSAQDSGDGISPEDLPHVFERFYKGEKSRNRSSGGAGLGLAIVKGIVDAHNGDIHVESELGKGTIFKVFLPKT